MLQTVQGVKGSLGRDVMLQTVQGVVRERREVTDSARGKVVVGGDVRLQTVQRGKGSLGRDVILQTGQG